MVTILYDGGMERPPKVFSSAEEEIHYLREQLAKQEQELLERTKGIDSHDIETIGKNILKEYSQFTPQAVLEKDKQLSKESVTLHSHHIELAPSKVDELLEIVEKEGVFNALQVLEKTNDPYLNDEVHRRLISEIRKGVQYKGLKEDTPMWQLMHMTLFEVTFTHSGKEEVDFHSIIKTTEQWFAGLRTILDDERNLHFAFEIAVAEGSDDIVFYVAVPNDYVSLFEKQTVSLFPDAHITLLENDYNIFTDNGAVSVSLATFDKHSIYPLATGDSFSQDPLGVVLNAFSKIEKIGGGASLQCIISGGGKEYKEQYKKIISGFKSGLPIKEAIRRSTIGGEIMASFSELIFSSGSKIKEPNADADLLTLLEKKLNHSVYLVNIRIITSASSLDDATAIRKDIEATFNQFSHEKGNALKFTLPAKGFLPRRIKDYSFRTPVRKNALPLNTEELATLIHFPKGIGHINPQFKQSGARPVAAPNDMATEGTLLGKNMYRGQEKEIYITPEDRLRHFYIIGQTGTGKTSLMKNMIIQDIQAGDGVCMIDPHGTDIDDVLATVPDSRIDDIIYFDPSDREHVLGLNMLEFDVAKPEQKTFVVNELFSIFQKLYKDTPESMGPMFEQYFRNATLLALEDPDSGSTLFDIAKVLANRQYRNYKLSKASNPVVVQFWREIATKAGGEASLENIVPYIVSKFDVFTANDYIRPIIGQQRSAFNFRQVLDTKKILLVNLSKGKIGDINAHLLGMIFVGKILMAALSRVDDVSKTLPTFYLHMDEFQNVSTNSISIILSEARKYKLSLTLAHQFLAQLDPTIKDAVFGNVGSIAAFRVGVDDAELLAKQFAPDCGANDLQTLKNRHAYLRLLHQGAPLKPFSMETITSVQTSIDRIEQLKRYSMSKYGVGRAEVEAHIKAQYQQK